MIKYDASLKPSEPLMLREAVLEFPDGRDFKPVINRRATKDFLDFCASYLPKIRQHPDYRRRRLEAAECVEFDLGHPERVTPSYPKALLDDILAR